MFQSDDGYKILINKWREVNETVPATPILIKIDYTLPTGGWQEKRLCIAPSIVQCGAT
jgi:hypothetical protein